MDANLTGLDAENTAEVTRAQAAELVLTTAQNTEATRAAAAESSLTTANTNEITRAEIAEARLTSGISTETTRAEGAETANSAAIATESTRAQAAEANLSARIVSASVTSLAYATTITPNFSTNTNFSVTLAGNTTLANPNNMSAGQSGVITITQDSTGSRAMSFGSAWKFANGTAPTLTTTAGAVDNLAYYVESSSRITAALIANSK